MRVYELAKKIGISSKELQARLNTMGVKANSHMTALDEGTVNLILKPNLALKPKAEAKPKPEPKPTAAPKPKPEKMPAETKVMAGKAAPSAKAAVPPKKHEVPKTPEAPAMPEVKVAPPLPIQPPPPPPKTIVLAPMTVGEFARKLHVNVAEVIKKLIQMGVMATINQYISEDTIKTISKEYGFTIEEPPMAKSDVQIKKSIAAGLVPRAPIVTVMGHVDHGKTTLLDAIRKTRVAEKEIGGITQHIGAYKIRLDKGEVVFLDTPGHEAFTAMRARGASATDIIVLVVAADDGIMPQTVEAINHASAAQVPIVVAINKIDRPNARPERVKQELMKYNLTPEEFGGKTICVGVSATKRIGIENLLEMLILEAELLELKADPSMPAKGVIIEGKMDKRRGPLGTVLVQNGTLKIGDVFVAGLSSGKVRAMTDEHGENMSSAPPSTPVEILGFLKVPYAGDSFEVVGEEAAAQKIIEQRKTEQEAKPRPVTLGNLYEQIKAGVKELKLVLKTDVRGSIEALGPALENLSDEKVMIRIIHRATGDINESDVMLASASGAIVIGFNVKEEEGAKEAAEKEGVDVRFYQIIYNAINDIKSAMGGLLEPVYKDVFSGRAEVRQVFNLPGGKKIAGCFVLKGKIVRGAKANIIRGKEKLFEGRITSLKRFKQDVKEVQEEYECGIGVEGFNDYREDDLIEVFTAEKVEG